MPEIGKVDISAKNLTFPVTDERDLLSYLHESVHWLDSFYPEQAEAKGLAHLEVILNPANYSLLSPGTHVIAESDVASLEVALVVPEGDEEPTVVVRHPESQHNIEVHPFPAESAIATGERRYERVEEVSKEVFVVNEVFFRRSGSQEAPFLMPATPPEPAMA